MNNNIDKNNISNYGLNTNDDKTLEKIQRKWCFHNDIFCELCLHTALKNLNNSIIPKECMNECMHPNNHASELFSHSGHDVYNLLQIIRKLKQEIDTIKKL